MSCRHGSRRRLPSARVSYLLGSWLVLVTPALVAAQVPTPSEFFGFQMGTAGRLADWPSILAYFETVAAASDRVEVLDVGSTTEGRRLIAAIVSDPNNIRRLDEIQADNKRLADPRTIDSAEADRVAVRHKAIIAIGCSIHSTEIGASQAANELLYDLATGDDAHTRSVLQDVVLVLMPSLNPDGHTLVVDWHDQNRGTDFEAAPMPWLYHKYVGHDINRDAFMMNMPENRALARFFYTEWHPHVFLTMHQMGSDRPTVLRAAELRTDRSELRSTHLANGRIAGTCHGTPVGT